MSTVLPTPTMNRSTLLEMLRRENQLRLSKEYQEMYDDVDLRISEIIEDTIQRQVLKEFNFEDTPENLHRYRATNGLFLNDPEIRNTVVYMKYDRANAGPLQVGDVCPDVVAIDLETGERKSVLSFAKEDRPLVILGGCYTCPPCRATVDEGNVVYEKLKDIVDFVFVYILEAHAEDEWKLGNKICIKQHKTLEERMEAARKFKEENGVKIPILVDTMDNVFNGEFAAWPTRFYVVYNGEMVYIEKDSDDGNIEYWPTRLPEILSV